MATSFEQKIPTFSLYGEQQWPTPDLLHWESIASRSALHEWVIKPHRHGNLWQLVYVENGEMKVHIEGREQQPKQPCLVLVPHLCVHGFAFSADVSGHVVTLAEPIIQSMEQALPDAGAILRNAAVLQLKPAERKELNSLFASIEQEYTQARPFREMALQALVSQLSIWLLRRLNSVVDSPKSKKHSQYHFAKFTELVEKQFTQHHPLEEYATHIGISKPHLNSVCRQFANCSALQFIHQRLLLEAKRHLIYTAMSISDISHSLGFSEPPYFTRFFKRFTGQSPVEFRKHNNG